MSTPAAAPPRLAIRARILVIEDEGLFARAVAKSLEAQFDVACATTLAAGRQVMQASAPDLVLLDLRLPDGNGMDFLAEVAALGDDRPQVLVLTAYGEIGDAVQAIKLGAADYLKKPIDLDELRLVVERVLETTQMRNQLDYSRERDSHVAVEGALLLGESAPIQRLRDQIHRLARLGGGTGEPPPTVLILGETGSGKDVAARLLHLAGLSRDQPFVQVDCASLPRDLIEAELFGHEKGAFTSAVGARAGLLEAAEKGTIFLDEIGELPLDLQAKLLNVIERRRTRRIGSVKERPIQARIMAGTNRDLPAMIADGEFRADLYYRLNVITLTVPPLRERGADIVTLARHFALQTSRRYGLTAHRFSPAAMEAMSRYHWPGNVRELRHLVERAVLLSHGAVIDAQALALTPTPQAMTDAFPLKGLTLEAAERMLIEQALRDTNDNVSEAARRLGVSRMTLRYRMDKYGFKAS
jgi:DNA-binding NtrC family response regulator